MNSTATLPAPRPATTSRHEKPIRKVHQDAIWDFTEKCLAQTAAALRVDGSVSAGELSHGINAVREAQAAGKPADLLEVIAQLQGHSGEDLGTAIHDLGNKVAAALGLAQHVVPFASRLVVPFTFYDLYNHIYKLARAVLAPVIYAENTDAIGTASANPAAALILAETIRTTVFKRFGIQPFVTTVRLDYENWTLLTHRHFEL